MRVEVAYLALACALTGCPSHTTTTCTQDSDCEAGDWCPSGTCVAGSRPQGDAGSTDAGADSGPADSGVPDAGFSYGSPCTSSSFCSSGANALCLSDVTGGYCSAECVSDSDCGAGGTCQSVNGATSICLATCSTTADCSRTGYVCQQYASGNACVPGCSSSSFACPQGTECALTGMCMGPVDAGRDAGPDAGHHDAGSDAGVPAGGTCMEASQCGGSDAVCITWVPDGYCTATCTTNSDCGAGGTCVPEPQIADGGDQDFCMAGCEPDGGCARDGYVCVNGACWVSCAMFACPSGTYCDDPDVDAGGACEPIPPPASDAGTLTPIAAGLTNPVSMAQLGAALYVDEFDPGTDQDAGLGDVVATAESAGSTPSTLEPSRTNAWAIATDATNLYWTELGTYGLFSGDYNNDGAVLQAPLAGGKVTTLAQGLTSSPTGLAVSVDTVYFAVQGTGAFGLSAAQNLVPSNGMILSVPVGGGAVTTLQTGQALPIAVAVDKTNLYWSNLGTFSVFGYMALYNNDGAVLQAPLGGTTVTTIAAGQSGSWALAVDSRNIYWANAGVLIPDAPDFLMYSTQAMTYTPKTGSVLQAPIGGTTATTLSSAQDVPYALAVSGESVYWANLGTQSYGGSVNVVPVGGGMARPLAIHLVSPTAVVVNGGDLFVTEYGTGNNDGVILEFEPAAQSEQPAP